MKPPVGDVYVVVTISWPKCANYSTIIVAPETKEKTRSERIPHAASYELLLKVMVFSPFKYEITYYHSSKGNEWWCPF